MGRKRTSLVSILMVLFSTSTGLAEKAENKSAELSSSRAASLPTGVGARLIHLMELGDQANFDTMLQELPPEDLLRVKEEVERRGKVVIPVNGETQEKIDSIERETRSCHTKLAAPRGMYDPPELSDEIETCRTLILRAAVHKSVLLIARREKRVSFQGSSFTGELSPSKR